MGKLIKQLKYCGLKVSNKMSRDANEGLISITGDNMINSILEINCETDFVAKNTDFINFVKELSEINHKVSSDIKKLELEKMKNGKTVNDALVDLISKIGEKITIGRSKTVSFKNCKNYIYQHNVVQDNLSKLAVISTIESNNLDDENLNSFGKQLSMHIAASSPLAINSENIDSSLIEKEKELIFEELKNSGKPKDIVEKIANGKLNKFKDDNSLMSQYWVMDPKKKVGEIIKENKDINIKVKDFVRFKIGE